ncbi:hypothetical protein CEQ21_04760 [Niallia circulans]|uniref:Uncharacterized protein n=1 Tax=Niallia circulans TaxID=1397 RepID=A0A553STD6_NIACI|nr:hypothetical protein [Niallia circulans]TRZ40252.1 hypothetical protein CEQ21_04760 [Niallia circulans]
MDTTKLKQDYIPKKLDFVNEMLIDCFKAVLIDKDDNRILHLMNDPYIPNYHDISGVYFIYQKSILDVLEKKYKSFKDIPINSTLFSERPFPENDLEDILDFSIMVVIASKDNEYFTDYFLGGSSERLNSILNLCLGFPLYENSKHYKNTITQFKKDINTVENMGFLRYLLEEGV